MAEKRAEMEQRLEAAGIWSPEMEHAACGVGLVAAIDGKPRREVVEKGSKPCRLSGIVVLLMLMARLVMAPAFILRSRLISSASILPVQVIISTLTAALPSVWHFCRERIRVRRNVAAVLLKKKSSRQGIAFMVGVRCRSMSI